MPRGGGSSGASAPSPRLFLSLRPLSPLIGWRPLLAPPAAAVREYQRVMAALAPPPEVTPREEEEEEPEGAGPSRDLLERLWDPEVPRQAAALISRRFLADILDEEEEAEAREAWATPKMAAPVAVTASPAKMAAPAAGSDLSKMAATVATATAPSKMAAPVATATAPSKMAAL